MFSFPTVFVDIETTGGGYRRSRVLEVAAIRYEDGEVTGEFSTLIDPQTYVPHYISKLTGITQSDVAGAPSFADVAGRLSELFEGAVFVAHNVSFDYSFLRAEFARLNIPFSMKRLCTVRLSRKLYKNHKGHSLEAIIRRHAIPFTNRHRALDDARAILHFTTLAHEEHGSRAFRAAVEHQLKNQHVPVHLEPERIRAIENSPGVYVFRDENDVVLYVGKSINMRSRVMSHFSDVNPKEVKLAQQTRVIETIPTRTELLALLLESRLIKRLNPVFNVQLRRVTTYCMVVREHDAEGRPTLSYVEGVPDDSDSLANIYGMYETRSKAKKWVDLITRTYNLCPRLMGLEKGKGACFSYGLGRCGGVCVGRELLSSYEERFEIGMAKSRIKTWPFEGPVEVDLDGAGSMSVDNWVITSIDTSLKLGTDMKTSRFDLDEYKILRSFLSKRFGHSVVNIA